MGGTGGRGREEGSKGGRGGGGEVEMRFEVGGGRSFRGGGVN